MDLALNNLQRLIYHKTQTTNPLKITRIFCNDIYFSRLYIFLNLISTSSNKEIMKIF